MDGRWRLLRQHYWVAMQSWVSEAPVCERTIPGFFLVCGWQYRHCRRWRALLSVTVDLCDCLMHLNGPVVRSAVRSILWLMWNANEAMKALEVIRGMLWGPIVNQIIMIYVAHRVPSRNGDIHTKWIAERDCFRRGRNWILLKMQERSKIGREKAKQETTRCLQ